MSYFFDPKTFTEDEILEKITELNKKIYQATRFNMSHEVLMGANNFVEALKKELTERTMQKLYNSVKDRLEKDIDTDKKIVSTDKNIRKILPLV